MTSEAEEPQKARLDRELSELLEEIRVVLPGVELLFAFLLILPFHDHFDEVVNGWERVAYVVAFMGTSFSTSLLIAPTTFHRLRFREGDKEALLRISNRQVIAASLLSALSVSLAVYVFMHVVVGRTLGALIAAGNALFFVVIWFVLPLIRRRNDETE